MNDPDSVAKQRFLMLSVVRLMGAAVCILGLAIISGKLPLPRPAGMVFTIFGLLEFALLPPFLASKWKSPRD